jgi:hypothetical protein
VAFDCRGLRCARIATPGLRAARRACELAIGPPSSEAPTDPQHPELKKLRDILAMAPGKTNVCLPELGWFVVVERQPGPHDVKDAVVRLVLFRASSSLQVAVNHLPAGTGVDEGSPDRPPIATFEVLASVLRAELLASDEAMIPGVGRLFVRRPRRVPGTSLINFRPDEAMLRRAKPPVN